MVTLSISGKCMTNHLKLKVELHTSNPDYTVGSEPVRGCH
jgi:hypothetical protein